MFAANRERRLTLKESASILVLISVGTAISFFALDFYDTSLVSAKLIFLVLSIAISVLVFYALLNTLKCPVHNRVAGSLWGALPWNGLQMWQLAHVGFFFIPLEVILSGLLVSFRTGIPSWQAIGTSFVVRMTVLFTYYSVRLEVINVLLGKS